MDGPYRERPPESGARQGCCLACGMRQAGEPRACPGCGAPYATVRCAECFHMSPPSAVLCTGCGQTLGLEPLGSPDDLCCPDCRLPFRAFEGAQGRLRDCERCGGQFVEHALLAALLDGRELYGAAAPRTPPRFNPLDDPVRYLRCPACDTPMARKNFGRTSGVIIDVCNAHGTWFDRGELPRVLTFVEAGGLAEARRREADERAERERRRAADSISPLSAPRSPLHRIGATRDLAEATLSLLDLVGRLSR